MFLLAVTYFVLLMMSVALVYLIKPGKKFWLLSIPLWGLLLTCFVFWRMVSDKQFQDLETKYLKSAGNRSYGDYDIGQNIEKLKGDAIRLNRVFIYLIGLQTLVTLIFQIVGEKRTKRKIYRWTKLIFGLFLTAMIFLVVLLAIVPTGPLI